MSAVNTEVPARPVKLSERWLLDTLPQSLNDRFQEPSGHCRQGVPKSALGRALRPSGAAGQEARCTGRE